MKKMTLFHQFIFESCDQTGLIFDHAHQKNFDQLLIFMIMYQPVLQMNIIPLPVAMNQEIKLNFLWPQ